MATKTKKPDTPTPPDNLGAVGLHTWRMDNDQHYRDVVLTPPSTKRHHNTEDYTDNTGGAAAQGDENTHKKTVA